MSHEVQEAKVNINVNLELEGLRLIVAIPTFEKIIEVLLEVISDMEIIDQDTNAFRQENILMYESFIKQEEVKEI